VRYTAGGGYEVHEAVEIDGTVVVSVVYAVEDRADVQTHLRAQALGVDLPGNQTVHAWRVAPGLGRLDRVRKAALRLRDRRQAALDLALSRISEVVE